MCISVSWCKYTCMSVLCVCAHMHKAVHILASSLKNIST